MHDSEDEKTANLSLDSRIDLETNWGQQVNVGKFSFLLFESGLV